MAPEWLILILLTAVIVVGWWMGRAGRAMTEQGGPGIVAFQLAEDHREVHRIFTRWGPLGKQAARRSLLIDYLWLLLYASLLFVCAWSVADAALASGFPQLALLGRWCAFGAVLAGLLDAVENTALLRELRRQPKPGVRIARLSARTKFALLGLVILYILVAFGSVQLAGG